MPPLVIRSPSPEETRRVGKHVGSFLHTGTTIALTGSLGCGKTVFVAGLARGLEVPTAFYITSPTYTLVNEYPGRLPLFHIDLYRISDVTELEDIGFDDIRNQNGIMAVEWADRVPLEEIRPDLSVRFVMEGENSRRLDFFFYGRQFANLIDHLRHHFTTG